MLKKIASELVGKDIYIQGTTPIMPAGATQLVYSPVAGKLVEVFDEGVSIIVLGDNKTSYYFYETMRSIEPYVVEGGGLALPMKSKLSI